METIEDKYHIFYIDKRRYYAEDLTIRNFYVENATPFRFCWKELQWNDRAWKNLIYNVALKFFDLIPKTQNEYLALKNDWGNQKVFSETKLKNHSEFHGIYINLNHTAVHSLWTLQLLLDFFGIDRRECFLLLSRHGNAEPKEARDYFRAKTLEGFRTYLCKTLLFSPEKSQKIIVSLLSINNYMPFISKSYSDLFLFDSGTTFLQYKQKVLQYLKFKKKLPENKLLVANQLLELLYQFYYINFSSRRRKKGTLPEEPSAL